LYEAIEQHFKDVAPEVDFCSLRVVRERAERLSVRQNVPQPVVATDDVGAMVTVVEGSGMGYAATSDLTVSGLRSAVEAAREWAGRSAGRGVIDFAKVAYPRPQGSYETTVEKPWESMALAAKLDLLAEECKRLKIDDRIVDWEAWMWQTEAESLFLTTDGGRVFQRTAYLLPVLSATANEGAETQIRTLAGRGHCRQGGLEVLDVIGFRDAAPRVASEALQLIDAPNCPSGTMNVLLDPDQMILQIHESIGHPLELDRILGDERNYAGTSFVTPEMIGSYRYGTDLLNITFDPSNSEEFASYGFDDEGDTATKEFIIENGILKRTLGGVTSRTRSDIAGVANARACSWNRPPIDRMANLNLEPGDSTFDEMLAGIEHGVYMKTNCSWSIDDSRNKFQFGCEWGQLIENGKLGAVVRNPNYRGISATFWRSLKTVGNRDTFEFLGTPYCGKGEPNQAVRVGHASPACVFTDVDVFGGE